MTAPQTKSTADLATRPAKTAGQVVSVEVLIQAAEAFGLVKFTPEQHTAAILVGTPVMTFLWNLAEILWSKVSRALAD